MRKVFKMAAAIVILSVIFNALFAVIGYFEGIYFNGTSYYGWDSYWIVFSIGMGCIYSILAVTGLAVVLISYAISD